MPWRQPAGVRQEHLDLFHAVAEAGSITAGGVHLHLSQPAASKRIADLERALGQRLLDRLPKRGVRLTAAGEVLFAYSQRIAALHVQAERSLRGLADLADGRIAVGASSTIGTYLLPPVVAAFRRDYPGVAIDLRIGNSDAMLALLHDARIDLAFTEDDRPATDDALEAEHLCSDDLVVVCRRGHRLLERASLSPRSLIDAPLILREPGSGARCVLEAALARYGLVPAPELILGSNEAIKQAILAGDHLAALPRMAVAAELADGRLRSLPIDGLEMRRRLLVLRLRWRGEGPAQRLFLQALRRRMAGRTVTA